MIKFVKQLPNTYFLLITILFFIFGNHAFEFLNIRGFANIIVFSLMFIGTYFSIEKKTTALKFLLILGLIFNLLILFSNSKAVAISVFLVSAFIFTIVTFILIYQISQIKKINSYVIIEAINGYLLIGVVSVLLNSIVVLLNVNAINFAAQPHLSDLIYYSYINLTSIGFGDIAPIGIIARKVSIFTGLAGQLYLAIIIALIIGKVSNSKTK